MARNVLAPVTPGVMLKDGAVPITPADHYASVIEPPLAQSTELDLR